MPTSAPAQERVPDRPRPPARSALPFWITQGPAGPEMHWYEDIVVPLSGEKKRIDIALLIGERGTVAWSRIAPHVVKLMELYRVMEKRNEELLSENERLKTDLMMCEGDRTNLTQQNKGLESQVR